MWVLGGGGSRSVVSSWGSLSCRWGLFLRGEGEDKKATGVIVPSIEGPLGFLASGKQVADPSSSWRGVIPRGAVVERREPRSSHKERALPPLSLSSPAVPVRVGRPTCLIAGQLLASQRGVGSSSSKFEVWFRKSKDGMPAAPVGQCCVHVYGPAGVGVEAARIGLGARGGTSRSREAALQELLKPARRHRCCAAVVLCCRGAVVVRCWTSVVLRCSTAAALRHCGTKVLSVKQSCSTAVLRCCSGALQSAVSRYEVDRSASGSTRSFPAATCCRAGSGDNAPGRPCVVEAPIGQSRYASAVRRRQGLYHSQGLRQ